jgi:hypothetical protein
MGDVQPGSLVRQAALSMLALGMVLVLAAPKLLSATEYVGLIAVVMTLLSVLCGIRLWMGGGLGARTDGMVVVVTCALGQAANFTVGVPGASTLKGQAGTLFWLAVGFETLTMLLLTVDGLRKRTA